MWVGSWLDCLSHFYFSSVALNFQLWKHLRSGQTQSRVRDWFSSGFLGTIWICGRHCHIVVCHLLLSCFSLCNRGTVGRAATDPALARAGSSGDPTCHFVAAFRLMSPLINAFLSASSVASWPLQNTGLCLGLYSRAGGGAGDNIVDSPTIGPCCWQRRGW